MAGASIDPVDPRPGRRKDLTRRTSFVIDVIQSSGQAHIAGNMEGLGRIGDANPDIATTVDDKRRSISRFVIDPQGQVTSAGGVVLEVEAGIGTQGARIGQGKKRASVGRIRAREGEID